MSGAKLETKDKHELWTEAASTATKLDNILCDDKEESPHRKFYGEDPEYERYLRTFGEMGIVTVDPGGAIKSKLEDRGIKCMFLGYASNHAGNVYRMLNLKTRKVLITRDVRWLEKSEKKKNEEVGSDDDGFEPSMTRDDEERDDEQDNVERNDDEENENVQVEETRVETPRATQRLSRELRGLEPYNRPGRLETEGGSNHFCFFIPETNNDDDDDTPTTFEEAWYHKDLKKREKWREAIRLEFRQMIRNGVWRNRGQKNIPQNRKGIGTKWVFKEKKNGVFRARLVVKGYDQIAGIDFKYNFAPVTSEVTLRILLVMWVIKNYFAEIADV